MPPAFSPTGIRLENIEKRYGGLYALRRVSLEIAAGECVALAGRNGSGKTTLLRIAARLVRPSFGNLSHTHIMTEIEEGARIAVRKAPRRRIDTGVKQVDVQVQLSWRHENSGSQRVVRSRCATGRPLEIRTPSGTRS